MNEFCLQFLQSCVGFLPLREIAHEPGKETLAARDHFSDRKLHRKCRAVLALAHDDAAATGEVVDLRGRTVGPYSNALDLRPWQVVTVRLTG